MYRGVTRRAQAMLSPLVARLTRPRVRGSAGPEVEAAEFDERGIPVPPLRLRGLVSGQDAVEEWLRGGAQDACLIRELVERHTGTLSEMRSILDFGCGCGRVARWWGDLHGPVIVGNDYDADLTNWCQENLPGIAVKTNAPEPPLPFDSDTFDFVYAISLFTHLTADAQEAWMRDVFRVLRPGGLLLFTVHGQIFTNHLTDQQRDLFAEGRIVVRNPEVNGAQACASYDPPAYVHGQLLPNAGLELIEVVPGDWAHGQVWTPMVLQDKYLARKPPRSRASPAS